jgi:hypothetical protein
MRTPTRAVLTLALAAAASVGCDGGTGLEEIAGTYALVTVNGRSLPAVVFEGTVTDPLGGEHDFTAEVLEGALTLREDGTFSVRFVERSTIDGVPSTDDDASVGTYTVSGSSITFTDTEDPEDVVTALLSGGTITANVTSEDPEGGDFLLIYVFQR